jgi:F-type H+-transporting ATPase subunit delta
MAHKDAGASLADVYAEAFYDAAREVGALPRVEEELLAFMCAVIQDERVIRFLESPIIPFADQRRVLRQALAGFQPVTVNFLLVVVRRGRLALLEQIARAFRDHSNRVAGIAEFQVTSARRLERDEARGLEAMLRRELGRPVVLAEVVRPALLGGVVLAHGDLRWDGSLAHRLRELVELMSEERPGEALWTG